MGETKATFCTIFSFFVIIFTIMEIIVFHMHVKENFITVKENLLASTNLRDNLHSKIGYARVLIVFRVYIL